MDNGTFPPIEDLIPHGRGMVLVDRVTQFRDNGITTAVRINDEALFADSHGVPTWVALEYLGQTIAAYAGLKARRAGEPVRIGFLVGARRFDPGYSHFPFGVELSLSADTITDGDSGLQIFECHILGPGIDCKTNLNVYLPDDVDSFMQENQR